MKSVMKNFYRRDAKEKKSIYFLKTLGLLCVEMQYETMSFHHTEDLITELLLVLTERIIKGTIVLSPWRPWANTRFAVCKQFAFPPIWDPSNKGIYELLWKI